jgi:hypothetical protein
MRSCKTGMAISTLAVVRDSCQRLKTRSCRSEEALIIGPLSPVISGLLRRANVLTPATTGSQCRPGDTRKAWRSTTVRCGQRGALPYCVPLLATENLTLARRVQPA